MNLVKPQQLEAERAVIASILDAPELFYESHLTPDKFFGVDNTIVYQVISSLIGNDGLIDLTLLKTHLIQDDKYNLIGGDTYFKQLAAVEHYKNHFSKYVELVTDSFLSRCIIETGKTITAAGHSSSAPEALNTTFNETGKLFDRASFGSNTVTVDSLMLEEMAAFHERLAHPGCGGIKTNFADFDLLMGGLYETDEVLIAARPSVGKSSLGLRMMLNLAKQGVPSLFFSYEMSKPQLMQRLLAMESGVGLSNIRSGMVMPDAYDKVAAAANSIGKFPIHFFNNYSASISEAIIETKRMVRKCGIKVVIFDYLQLMPYRVEYATQDLGLIARQLKNLGMSTNIVVIAMSQLNRMVELRTNREPVLSDLRQSGNLEEHADVVLMLQREEIHNPAPENIGKAKLFIRKNRNGPIGVLPLNFNAPTADFSGGI